MGQNINTVLNHFSSQEDRKILSQLLHPTYNALSSISLTNAGLVISGAGGTAAKTGAAAYYACVNGVLVTKAGATAMPALVGSVTNAKFNVFVFTMDNAGTLYVQLGTEAASLALVKFPNVPLRRALVGFIVINPTGTGNFVGGTTALDDATVVPNAAYISIVGGFDPTSTT